jgi:probable F420-dependent oxidoreductase
MKIGAIYPQSEMQTDPGAVRHYAQAVEAMGFDHILAYDHVLGANRASRPGVFMPYDLDTTFMEPLMLFSHIAAFTKTIGFITGVMILTQRQAVLVAKQVACLDILSEGRYRLGLGTGWNAVEYEALGMDFSTRGKRLEEQIAVMRALWTNRAVTFNGEYHTITDAGLFPMPTQQVPIWIGGGNDRPVFGEKANMNVLRRVARIADGWIQQDTTLPRATELIGQFREFVVEYGRDPAKVGIQAMYHLGNRPEDSWAGEIASWRKLEVSHMAVNTMNQGLSGVDAHLKRLEQFRQAVPA